MANSGREIALRWRWPVSRILILLLLSGGGYYE